MALFNTLSSLVIRAVSAQLFGLPGERAFRPGPGSQDVQDTGGVVTEHCVGQGGMICTLFD